MTAPILYVTGTTTGVGKTTLATLLLRRARERNLRWAAMKPFCSGDRNDAEALHALQTAGLGLDQLNPFYFAEPIAPYVAAKNVNRRITLDETLQHIRNIAGLRFPFLIEGAGGLMSPLGERFTLLDIIREIPGAVCVVGANTLGVINAALLTARALENVGARKLDFVLMDSKSGDASVPTNAAVICEWTGARVQRIPHLAQSAAETPLDPLASTLDALLGSVY
jgi:dethiobiotin synthetase